MDVLTFRDYCLSLPMAEESTPFDETTLVYKVGGKVFAICGLAGGLSFKVTEIGFMVLIVIGVAGTKLFSTT